MLHTADTLKALRDKKNELQAQLKEVQAQIDDAEAALIEMMTTEECSGFDRSGSRFSLVIKEYPGAVPEEKDELYAQMRFGSGENGGMACKQKRCLYLLREGEILPIIMTLPTGSLGEFTKYVTRLVAKGKHANTVVTKFGLKKAQNSTGIAYSQATFATVRNLAPAEKQAIASMSAQVKAMASTVAIEDVTDEPIPVDPQTGEAAEPLK